MLRSNRGFELNNVDPMLRNNRDSLTESNYNSGLNIDINSISPNDDNSASNNARNLLVNVNISSTEIDRLSSAQEENLDLARIIDDSDITHVRNSNLDNSAPILPHHSVIDSSGDMIDKSTYDINNINGLPKSNLRDEMGKTAGEEVDAKIDEDFE